MPTPNLKHFPGMVMKIAVSIGRLLLWSPRRALMAAWWYATNRRVRARNQFYSAIAEAPFAYQHWIGAGEKAEQGPILADEAQEPAGNSAPSRLTVIVRGGGHTQSELNRVIRALERQSLRDWQLVLVPGACSLPKRVRKLPNLCKTAPAIDPALAVAAGLAATSGTHVLILPDQALLPPTALALYARTLRAQPELPVVYGDQDRISRWGRRHSPWLKPEWNAELFLAQDYLSSACMIRSDLAREALTKLGDTAGLATHDTIAYAVLLAVLQSNERVVHLPHVLCHLPDKAVPANCEVRAEILRRTLAESGADVTCGPFDTVRISWPLPDKHPLVSIIVPTRDKAELLRACVSGILTKTSYRPFELIIIDNSSTETDALAYLAELSVLPGVRVLRDQRPYNYSALNNTAVAVAQGEYVCLLNNDTEVLEADWLTQLMRQAVRPEVGAAGAKLVYDDRSIQHAGVVVGVGEAAGHAHRHLQEGQPGYFARSHAQHFVTAVTAACLVVAKDKFEAVDGLDQESLAIAFNDVDFCLKLQAHNWHNVYVPQAVLVHHESKSRGQDISAEHIQRYMRELEVLQDRWQTKTYRDPLHHPHLDRYKETYTIRLA